MSSDDSEDSPTKLPATLTPDVRDHLWDLRQSLSLAAGRVGYLESVRARGLTVSSEDLASLREQLHLATHELDALRLTLLGSDDVEISGGAGILIVDDEPRYCRSLERPLRALGLTVFIETVPERAVPTALQAGPSVAFVDMSMPRRNGIEVAAELTKCLPDLCVVLMTGFLTDERVFEAAQVAHYVVEKGVGLEPILRIARGERPEQRAFTVSSSRVLQDRDARAHHARSVREQFDTARDAAKALGIAPKTLAALLDHTPESK